MLIPDPVSLGNKFFGDFVLHYFLIALVLLQNCIVLLAPIEADTIFHRLICHEGFQLRTPYEQSELEQAINHCVARHHRNLPTHRDCLNYCIAEKVEMFVITEASSNKTTFDRVKLELVLWEWFAGENGTRIVKYISTRFEDCVKRHSSVLHYLHCIPNPQLDSLRSNQTSLWKCFRDALPCFKLPPPPTPRIVTTTARSIRQLSFG